MASFASRLAAGKEASYFMQESKQAVSRLSLKQQQRHPPSSGTTISSPEQQELSPDVLPEILRHSLPAKIFKTHVPSESCLNSGSKWEVVVEKGKRVKMNDDALNPLRGYLSLPQVTFGPKRWNIPNAENSFNASTANDLRRDKQIYLNPEKLKAAAEGLTHIGKSFAIATAIVFGGSTIVFGWTASNLDLHNSGKLKDKGRILLQPSIEKFRDQLVPLRIWAENTSKKWRLEKDTNFKENSFITEISKILGSRKN